MQPDDQIAECLVRWEEAQEANPPPPALEQLPAELRPRASECLRLLRGFARRTLGLTTSAPAPCDAPQLPPSTPRYRFEAFLACGGMGEVWRGHDTLLARAVALKVLRERVLADGGARANFEDEARHVSGLERPSIVPVYERLGWARGTGSSARRRGAKTARRTPAGSTAGRASTSLSKRSTTLQPHYSSAASTCGLSLRSPK
jgi:hypothetical protein